MTTGEDLNTFITGLNGGATIDVDLLNVLVNTARAVLEEERPWMVLRRVDTSKTVTTASTYTTVIDLSTIADFSLFYSDVPIRLFDGVNRIEYYRLVPFDRQLEYKDVSNTACYDDNSKRLYLNGTVPFNGTLYINYQATSADIDVSSTSAIWTYFPPRFLPILAFYAVGIHKGAVDYDTINQQMMPENRATLAALHSSMVKWDDNLQMSSLSNNDPTEYAGGFPRSGAIDRYV